MQMIATRHEVTGHLCDFPENTLDTWRSLGWIPVSELPEPAATPDISGESTSASTTKPAARRRATETEE